jgi:hypothetical protein
MAIKYYSSATMPNPNSLRSWKKKLWFNRAVHIGSVFSLFSRAALSSSFLRLLSGNDSVNESVEPNPRAAGCGTRLN